MNIKATIWIFIIIFCTSPSSLANALDSDFVILLHGLARSKDSMTTMANRLSAENYRVINLEYPSRSKTIEAIANSTLSERIEKCRETGAKTIHFVSHSMGGIIVRYYLKHHEMEDLGKVVMLSPPNKGSEVVDKLGDTFIFEWINGPAGQQLGTKANSLPRQLGEVDFELGVIAGNQSINPVLSLLIPGEDDGKVSVKNTKVAGMADFVVIPATHTFIMNHPQAIEQTISFLKSGQFKQ